MSNKILGTHKGALFQNGPYPMQLVVPSAVRNAVSAATITFTATSIKRFFFIRYFLHLTSAFSLSLRHQNPCFRYP